MRFLIKKTPDNFIKAVNDEISSILNRHFGSYYPEYGYEENNETFSMPIEVNEREKEYEIRAELPGVKKEDLDIDIDKNYITIRAKKLEETHDEDKSYKKTEFQYGEFSRSLYLPLEVDINKTEATLEHGVLKIKAPKLNNEKDTVKKISVK